MTPVWHKALAIVLAVVLPVVIALSLPIPESQIGPNGELPSNGLGRALFMLVGGAIIYYLSLWVLGRTLTQDGDP